MRDLPPDVAAGLAPLREATVRAKREGILLIRRPLRSGEEPGSYIGGLPRLGEELDWPVSTRTGLPLSFIAQIDLSEVPRPQGVFFPAEGLLWFFADFAEEQFSGDEHTRVLFDPHPGILPLERPAPANLPPLQPGGGSNGWFETQHPRAFVEPKAGLSMHLFDTFPDWYLCIAPHERTFDSVVYMQMIDALREDALRRAIGVDRSQGGYWYMPRSGFGEAHWPATSVDAEYALMALMFDLQVRAAGANPIPMEVVTDVAARLQDQIRNLRSLGPRPLAPPERAPIHALIESFRDRVGRSDSEVRFEVERSYPHAAFEILSTMPEAEKYVPPELLHPYQELMLGGPLYFHQMFGHGSSPQTATEAYEDYVLLLQIGGSMTLGLPLMGDGAMHYWIPKEDLASGRFDRVEGTWEAG